MFDAHFSLRRENYKCKVVFSAKTPLDAEIFSNTKSLHGFCDSYENFCTKNSLFAFTPHPNEHDNESARCGAFFFKKNSICIAENAQIFAINIRMGKRFLYEKFIAKECL